ncbi:MAG: nucleotidyltransferase family protein [Prevotella sp.]|nr:nucleotidyltransferase family protein [Candidatus Equicola stercoris]
MQAMIFAAGLGTRLKPLTDTMPKALVPVNGKPLLQHVLERLAENGCSNVVVNVHHFSQQIKDFLHNNDKLVQKFRSSEVQKFRSSKVQNLRTSEPQNPYNLDISISDESDMLLETGGGIKKAVPLFNAEEPILIHNVDIFCDIDLKTFYSSSKDNAATLLVSKRESSRYLYFDDDDNLVAWANMKTQEIKSPFAEIRKMDVPMLEERYRRYAFSGIHIFSPVLFKYFDSFPERFGIIDFYLKVCEKEKIKCFVKDGLRLLDVGKMDTLKEAETFWQK